MIFERKVFMKKPIKALALLLSLVILSASASVSCFAAASESYIPSIIVPGIFQSEVKYYENGEVALNSEGEEYQKPFFIDPTKEVVADALTTALVPISKLLISQKDKDEMAANAVADVLARTLMEKQKCDENGKFINDIRATKYYDSVKDLSDYDREYIFNQLPLQDYSEPESFLTKEIKS